jgi:hypothetical protein
MAVALDRIALLPPDEQRGVLGENATAFYGLKAEA